MKEKYWLTLLKNWRARGRNGLSINYLIGSQDFLPTTHLRQNITQLLDDVASQHEYVIEITICMDLNDLILRMGIEYKGNLPGIFLPDQQGYQTHLFLNKHADDLGATVGEVATTLTNRYQIYIDHKLYSRINHQYRPFTTEDIQFIHSNFLDH